MSDLDLENRELCPDGSCIGVIGPEGRCEVCGKKGSRPVQPYRSAPAGSAPAEEADDGDGDEALAADAEGSDDAFSPNDRELCPDGACVGLIGPNGRCTICGSKR